MSGPNYRHLYPWMGFGGHPAAEQDGWIVSQGKEYLYRVRPAGDGNFLAERLVQGKWMAFPERFARAMLACYFCSDVEGSGVETPAVVTPAVVPGGTPKGLARLLAQRAAKR